MTIQLINNVSRVVNNDPDVKGKLAVYFPWNYNVRLAQHLIPATDLDEQISQAGKEASGTGNMKFALNGAMTVGTLDGANVEIRERVGAENFFLFGMTVDEVEKKYAEGYNPASYYEADPRLKHAIDMVADGTFSNGDRNAYSPLVADWLTKDWFMTLADFSATWTSSPRSRPSTLMSSNGTARPCSTWPTPATSAPTAPWKTIWNVSGTLLLWLTE